MSHSVALFSVIHSLHRSLFHDKNGELGLIKVTTGTMANIFWFRIRFMIHPPPPPKNWIKTDNKFYNSQEFLAMKFNLIYKSWKCLFLNIYTYMYMYIHKGVARGEPEAWPPSPFPLPIYLLHKSAHDCFKTTSSSSPDLISSLAGTMPSQLCNYQSTPCPIHITMQCSNTQLVALALAN